MNAEKIRFALNIENKQPEDNLNYDKVKKVLCDLNRYFYDENIIDEEDYEITEEEINNIEGLEQLRDILIHMDCPNNIKEEIIEILISNLNKEKEKVTPLKEAWENEILNSWNKTEQRKDNLPTIQ